MKYVKTTLLISALILLLSLTSAQNQSTNETVTPSEELAPGLIKADSPLYGLSVGLDNALMTVGVTDPGTIAHKRASEAVVAAQRGNQEAATEALNALNTTVERADNNHVQGLEKAEDVLNNANESVNAEGLDIALNGITEAKNRVPRDFTDSGGGGVLPDIRGAELGDQTPSGRDRER